MFYQKVVAPTNYKHEPAYEPCSHLAFRLQGQEEEYQTMKNEPCTSHALKQFPDVPTTR